MLTEKIEKKTQDLLKEEKFYSKWRIKVRTNFCAPWLSTKSQKRTEPCIVKTDRFDEPWTKRASWYLILFFCCARFLDATQLWTWATTFWRCRWRTSRVRQTRESRELWSVVGRGPRKTVAGTFLSTNANDDLSTVADASVRLRCCLSPCTKLCNKKKTNFKIIFT